jgi:sigma-B regulation protein RsbU (phosphoserine phosphatase)
VLYTDGVTEAMNADHQLFGDDRLLACLEGTSGGTATETTERILNAVRAHAGDQPQSDDITIVTVRRAAPAA